MHLTHRAYDELSRDFERIWKFLLDDYAHRRDQSVWLFSRFGDWKYGLWGEIKFFPPFFRENAHLWFNDLGELLGFVICESGDSNFTIFTRQGYRFLYADLLEWVTTHWQDRDGSLKTEINEFQTEDIPHLERCGFVNKGQVAVTRQYNLAEKAVEPIRLDDEFRIVDCLIDQNYASKRLLQRRAFDDQNSIRDIHLWIYAYARECPCYDPKYDLSVIDPEGKHVSSCVGYVDYEHRVAEIEKVCTDPDFRRRGLAEAVIRACFQRLAADGFEYAYITGYSDEAIRLYGSLGAVREKRWDLYEAT